MRALVFDFDGLICETEGPHFEVLTRAFVDHGVELAFEDYAVCIGTQHAFDPFEHLETLIGSPIDREALGESIKERYLAICGDAPMLPGVLDLLDEARAADVRCAVASSSSRRWVGGHLDRLGIADRFDALCTADDVDAVKPDPALYALALSRLGVDAARAVAIEDSPNGSSPPRQPGCAASPCPTWSLGACVRRRGSRARVAVGRPARSAQHDAALAAVAGGRGMKFIGALNGANRSREWARRPLAFAGEDLTAAPVEVASPLV